MRRMLERFFQDSSKGLEYNLILATRRISSGVYLVDIAHTPHVVRGDRPRADVQRGARHANADNDLVNGRSTKFKGRD